MPIRRSRTVTRTRTVGGRRRKHIRGRGKFMDWMRKAGAWVRSNGPTIGRTALQVFQNPAVRSLAAAYVPSSAGVFYRGDQLINAGKSLSSAINGSGRRRIRIPIRSKNGRFRRGGSLGHGLGP